jgi:hypothetical protein
MKKFIVILSIFFIQLQAHALEDCLLVSDFAIHGIIWSDDVIVSAVPILTIDNRKNSVIIKAKAQGEAVITFETDDGEKVVNIEVLSDKTTLSAIEGFTYFSLDKPEVTWTN